MTVAKIRQSFFASFGVPTRFGVVLLASERDVNQMTSVGFKPLRYRQMRD